MGHGLVALWVTLAHFCLSSFFFFSVLLCSSFHFFVFSSKDFAGRPLKLDVAASKKQDRPFIKREPGAPVRSNFETSWGPSPTGEKFRSFGAKKFDRPAYQPPATTGNHFYFFLYFPESTSCDRSRFFNIFNFFLVFSDPNCL